MDAYWAYVLHRTWHKGALDLVVQEILDTVPPGSIFFGDSDPGRFAVGLATESSSDEKEILVITQNQLADPSYWTFVLARYGTRIHMPAFSDYEPLFAEYQSGKLGPWPAAVQTINAHLSKVIFERNTNRPVFIEATFFLPEWAYPYLVPKGLVFELNREPMPRVLEEVLTADRAYWASICSRCIGFTVPPSTSVDEVCDYAQRAYLHRNLEGFIADRDYPGDLRLQESLGSARHATARIYLWRSAVCTNLSEKQRMLEESLHAYQQVFALAPSLAMDFAGLLESLGRPREALRVLELSTRYRPNSNALAEAEKIRLKFRSSAPQAVP